MQASSSPRSAATGLWWKLGWPPTRRAISAAQERVARCLPARADLPHRVLLVLSDGLAGDQQEVVRGAYGVLGAGVPLVGRCAGDDLKMTRTFQLYDDRALTDSIVAAGIASDAPLGIGVRHGWRRVGDPMLVTASAGNQVYTLDDRPALDVYLEQLGLAGLDRQDPCKASFGARSGLARRARHSRRTTRGSGLVGLRDRVEALGGRVVHQRNVGLGTSLSVELPPSATADFVALR